MKKICLLLLYVALSGQISAQTIKTYKGGMSESPVETIDFGYNLGLSLAPRIWSYQYYEDETGERVYHGKLTHSFQFAPNLFYTITGQYSHGKREGQWVWQVIGDNKKNYEKYIVNSTLIICDNRKLCTCSPCIFRRIKDYICNYRWLFIYLGITECVICLR